MLPPRRVIARYISASRARSRFPLAPVRATQGGAFVRERAKNQELRIRDVTSPARAEPVVSEALSPDARSLS
jgi:hypothetical protein